MKFKKCIGARLLVAHKLEYMAEQKKKSSSPDTSSSCGPSDVDQLSESVSGSKDSTELDPSSDGVDRFLKSVLIEKTTDKEEDEPLVTET